MSVETDPGVGEPAGIRSLANERSSKAAELQRVHTAVKSAAETVSATSWTGKSREAFGSAVDSVLPDLALLAGGLAAQAATLHTYAGHVQQIKEEQAALEQQRRTALAALAGLHAQYRNAEPHLLTPVAIPDPDRDAQQRREQARITEKIDAERSITRRHRFPVGSPGLPPSPDRSGDGGSPLGQGGPRAHLGVHGSEDPLHGSRGVADDDGRASLRLTSQILLKQPEVASTRSRMPTQRRWPSGGKT